MDHKSIMKLGKVHSKMLNMVQQKMLEFSLEMVYQKGSEMPSDFCHETLLLYSPTTN